MHLFLYFSQHDFKIESMEDTDRQSLSELMKKTGLTVEPTVIPESFVVLFP